MEPVFSAKPVPCNPHLRSTVDPLDTGTPGTSIEIYSEGADDGTRTRNPSVITALRSQLQLSSDKYMMQ